MKKPVVRKLRCAVYTRKSSEEGLEQEFNSLHAQREACEAYIASQKSEGWTLVPDRYDDGGISGGTLERPALKRLVAEIEAKRVDIVVVYKIDRLSRSLVRFLQARRVVRAQRRLVRQRHAAVQHVDLDGAADAEHAALLRAVRARGHRRAHPGQVRGLASEGHVDGRVRSARLRREGPQAGREQGRGGDSSDDLRTVHQDRLGHQAGAGTARGGRVREARALIDKSYVYTAVPEPGLHRRGGAQGHVLSRRARGDHQQGAMGQGAVHPRRGRQEARRPHPSPDTSAAERSALRADRLRHDADAYPEGGTALPLLHRDRTAEARRARLHGEAGARRRDRARRDRSGPPSPPCAGDDRADMARRQAADRRAHRNAGA